MLKTKSVAKLIQDTLNKQSTEEQFRVVYEYGSYKGTEINAIIKQGKGTITPIMNYTTSTNPFFIEFVVPTRCGEDRIDGIVEIINGMIDELNGKIKPVGNGRCMFAFNPLEIGGLETRATAGQSVLMKLEFNIEYSETSGKADEVVYEMALINSPFFEMESENTRFFEDENLQYFWYKDRIENGGVGFTKTFTPINPSVINQQITYINENEIDNDKILSNNCAIIRALKNNKDIKYYYYRVESAIINAFNQVVFALQMDTLQTYYFGENLEIPDCLITRAHLNRWSKDITGYGDYIFDFSLDSKLFTREDVRGISKRAIDKRKLYPILDSGGVFLNNWFKENVSHWVYYYISGERSYHFRHASDVGKMVYERELGNIKFTNTQINIDESFGNVNLVDGGMVVLVAPVYKTNKVIKISYVDYGKENLGFVDTREWKEVGIYKFLNFRAVVGDPDNPEKEIIIGNGGNSGVYAKKYSIMPPFFSSLGIGNQFEEDDDGNLIFSSDDGVSDTGFGTILNCVDFIRPRGDENACAGRVIYQNIRHDMQFYIDGDDLYKGVYERYEITDPKAKIEPKLLNEDYSTYRLYIGGNSYDLPISKTSMKPQFIYKEVFSPDITKSLLIYDAKNSKYPSGVFTEIQNKDFTGFFIEVDLSMWIENNQLDSFLATNRNNMQIMNKTQNFEDSEFARGIYSGLANMFSQHAMSKDKDSADLGSQMVSYGISGISSALSLDRQQKHQKAIFNLTLDNMRQSPQTLSGLNSNALLIDSVDDLGIYIEVQKPLPSEEEIVIDELTKFGYSVNIIANVREYDNCRRMFNYVQATIDSVVGEVSNEIKTDIKQRFATGIRFWNNDDMNYESDFESNYEQYLMEV